MSRNPELDGVRLPVEVEEAEAADQCDGQRGQDHEDRMLGAKSAMAKKIIISLNLEGLN